MAAEKERSFQKQPTVFLNKKSLIGKTREKAERYTRNVGLGFKTPKDVSFKKQFLVNYSDIFKYLF